MKSYEERIKVLYELPASKQDFVSDEILKIAREADREVRTPPVVTVLYKDEMGRITHPFQKIEVDIRHLSHVQVTILKE